MIKKLTIDRLVVISNEIFKIAEDKQISVMDACILYAEANEIEIEVLGEILKKNKKMSGVIEKEAEELNFFKKEDRLEFS